MSDGFKEWKTCHEVSLSFQYAADARGAKCVRCRKRIDQKERRWWPNFHAEATRCGAGHKPKADARQRVCYECEVNLVLNITKRRQVCFKKRCNRLLIVAVDAVRAKVAQAQTFEEYSKLVDKYQVFDCVVCMVSHPLSAAPQLLPTARCDHEPLLCAESLQLMISNAVLGGTWQTILCPIPDCREQLDGRDVRRCSTAETFTAYDVFATNRTLANDPWFRWCGGRDSDGAACKGSVFLLEDAGPRDWRCDLCHTLNCFKCRRPHPLRSCDEATAEDPAAQQAILRISKRCPARGCGRRIQKDGGCINMGCHCGISFCWECKVIYGPSDDATACGCGRHSSHSGCSRHLVWCSMARSTRAIPFPDAGNCLYAVDWHTDPEYTGPVR